MANRKHSVTYLSSHAVARLLAVCPSTVLNWIEKGTLPAHRTPGGHRRVRRDELLTFISREGLSISLENADQTVREPGAAPPPSQDNPGAAG